MNWLREKYDDASVDFTVLENEVLSHRYNFFRRYYFEPFGNRVKLWQATLPSGRAKQETFVARHLNSGQRYSSFWHRAADQGYKSPKCSPQNFANGTPVRYPLHHEHSDADN